MPVSTTRLNANASALADAMIRDADALRIAYRTVNEAAVLDCGVEVPGGLAAGVRVAELCLAGLGTVQIQPGRPHVYSGIDISVQTDHPLSACIGSQYAGWNLSVELPGASGDAGKYFAMASGPMRAARSREEILEHLALRDESNWGVGVLESGELPPPEAIDHIAKACGLPNERIVVAVARTASIVGGVQVVARSVETALHKLEQLGFDLHRVVSGFGVAPLPPIANDDLTAIGRTNDAVLYGGETTLWVRGDDASLEALGPQTPSSASRDFGEPFGEIFKRYNYDFYEVDPMLFSPAVVRFHNVETGRSFTFGATSAEVLQRSFSGA